MGRARPLKETPRGPELGGEGQGLVHSCIASFVWILKEDVAAAAAGYSRGTPAAGFSAGTPDSAQHRIRPASAATTSRWMVQHTPRPESVFPRMTRVALKFHGSPQ